MTDTRGPTLTDLEATINAALGHGPTDGPDPDGAARGLWSIVRALRAQGCPPLALVTAADMEALKEAVKEAACKPHTDGDDSGLS